MPIKKVSKTAEEHAAIAQTVDLWKSCEPGTVPTSCPLCELQRARCAKVGMEARCIDRSTRQRFRACLFYRIEGEACIHEGPYHKYERSAEAADFAACLNYLKEIALWEVEEEK